MNNNEVIINLLHKLSDFGFTILFLIVLPLIIIIAILTVLTRKIYINILNKCVIKLNIDDTKGQYNYD
jgi:hypothetical protein